MCGLWKLVALLLLLTSDKNGKVKRGSSVVRHLPLVLEVPGFDPRSWRGKFLCLNTLSLVSFAGMTLDKCIVWIGSSSSSSFSALRLLCHSGKVYLHKFNVGMATQVRLLQLVVTLTVCPLCRESPLVQVKEPYGNFDMVTCRLSSCNPECTKYTCR